MQFIEFRFVHPRLFIDTSAFVALSTPGDTNHDAAVKFGREVIRKKHILLYTSNYVVAETVVNLQRQVWKGALQPSVPDGLWNDLHDPSFITVEPITEQLLTAGWEIVNSYADQHFSLIDGTSFALMRHLGISDAFVFDKHFQVFSYLKGYQRICVTTYP